MCELARGAHIAAQELSPYRIVEGAMALRRFLCVVRVPRQLRCAANTAIELTGFDLGRRGGAALSYMSSQQVVRGWYSLRQAGDGGTGLCCWRALSVASLA